MKVQGQEAGHPAIHNPCPRPAPGLGPLAIRPQCIRHSSLGHGSQVRFCLRLLYSRPRRTTGIGTNVISLFERVGVADVLMAMKQSAKKVGSFIFRWLK